jgi:hypothetical protein
LDKFNFICVPLHPDEVNFIFLILKEFVRLFFLIIKLIISLFLLP